MGVNRRSFIRHASTAATIGVISGCTADDTGTDNLETTTEEGWSPDSVTGKVTVNDNNAEILSHTFFSEYRESDARRAYGIRGVLRSKLDFETPIDVVAKLDDDSFWSNPIINDLRLRAEPINEYAYEIKPGEKAQFEGSFFRDSYHFEHQDRTIEDIEWYELWEVDF